MIPPCSGSALKAPGAKSCKIDRACRRPAPPIMLRHGQTFQIIITLSCSRQRRFKRGPAPPEPRCHGNGRRRRRRAVCGGGGAGRDCPPAVGPPACRSVRRRRSRQRTMNSAIAGPASGGGVVQRAARRRAVPRAGPARRDEAECDAGGRARGPARVMRSEQTEPGRQRERGKAAGSGHSREMTAPPASMMQASVASRQRCLRTLIVWEFTTVCTEGVRPVAAQSFLAPPGTALCRAETAAIAVRGPSALDEPAAVSARPEPGGTRHRPTAAAGPSTRHPANGAGL